MSGEPIGLVADALDEAKKQEVWSLHETVYRSISAQIVCWDQAHRFMPLFRCFDCFGFLRDDVHDGTSSNIAPATRCVSCMWCMCQIELK